MDAKKKRSLVSLHFWSEAFLSENFQEKRLYFIFSIRFFFFLKVDLKKVSPIRQTIIVDMWMTWKTLWNSSLFFVWQFMIDLFDFFGTLFCFFLCVMSFSIFLLNCSDFWLVHFFFLYIYRNVDCYNINPPFEWTFFLCLFFRFRTGHRSNTEKTHSFFLHLWNLISIDRTVGWSVGRSSIKKEMQTIEKVSIK